MCDFLLVINRLLTYILSHTVSKSLQIIGQICAFARGGDL